jgi:hypothetical protein
MCVSERARCVPLCVATAASTAEYTLQHPQTRLAPVRPLRTVQTVHLGLAVVEREREAVAYLTVDGAAEAKHGDALVAAGAQFVREVGGTQARRRERQPRSLD